MKNLAITLLAACCVTASHARHLTPQQALERAVQHECQFSNRSTALSRVRTADKQVTHRVVSGVYVFDLPGGGFVVTPQDDASVPVLARADVGRYDEAVLPPAFQTWLSEITKYGPASLSLQGPAADQPHLLGDIAWTQDQPMNDLCPTYSYDGYTYRTYAGCVAIALAQIMRYYGFPEKGTGHIDYYTDSYKLHVATDLDGHRYDWEHILPNYIYNPYTAADRTAVATLVYDVAAAVQMDFSPGASNTQDFRAGQALKVNFGFDKSLRLIDHSRYATAEWADVIRAEIDAGRPVYVSGAHVVGTSVAGHAFVVDGYRADGTFHINWGWGGTADGYYSLTDLTPKDQGIGGGRDGYSFMQNAIVGIQPDRGGAESPAELMLIYDQIWTEKDSRGVALHFFVGNTSATDFHGLMALRVRDGEGKVLNDVMATALRTTCKAGYSGERAWYIDLNTLGRTPGTRFEIVVQRDGDTEWEVLGARLGSPASLVSYIGAGGAVSLQPDAQEIYDFHLHDLQAIGDAVAGRTVDFTARIENGSDYEYFAPFYLMVYDMDDRLVAYSDYRLHQIAPHATADVSLTCQLPAVAGSYHLCVAYENLGYNYDYIPMPRTAADATAPTTYDYVMTLVDETSGGGGDEPEPEGTYDYVMTCVDYGADALRRDVKVRFEGNEVYIQGISPEVPDGWAHATLVEGTARFETPLLLGQWNYYGSTRPQYVVGADTSTGDVSTLVMAYDAETRTFTSYANNWMLLTSDPTQVGFYYDHLFNSITLIPANGADDDPLVHPADGLSTTAYQVKGVNPYDGLPTDYHVSIGREGSDVYIQGLYPAFPQAWVKGVMDDASRQLTLALPQYVGNYHGLYAMYVAGVDPDTERICTLIFDYDAATRTYSLNAQSGWFLVQAGDPAGEILPMMLLTEMTMAPYVYVPADRILVEVPEALQPRTFTYTLSALDAESHARVQRNVQVATDGREVFVQGLSEHFPTAWIRGEIGRGGVTVFPRNQYAGTEIDYDFWFGAGDVTCGEMLYGDFILRYDPATGGFAQPETNYFVVNASNREVMHLEMLQNVTLVPVGSIDGIRDHVFGEEEGQPLFPASPPALSDWRGSLLPRYDLSGRHPLGRQGIVVRRDGRKMIAR